MKSDENVNNKHEDWAKSILPRHSKLSSTAKKVLENLITNRGIDFLSVTHRTKDLPGITEKIQRKRYDDPQRQMTDITGIRVVTFLDSDVRKVSSLIREEFDVDPGKSSDKSSELGADRLGYRSVHFVCKLNSKRTILSEYAEFCDLYFEIQIRTVLQHAWAELSHDRGYKFAGGLPTEIARKLNLYSGMLELADSGFGMVAKEIDDYKAATTAKTKEGDLDIEINPITLPEYFRQRRNGLITEDQLLAPLDALQIASELKFFGIRTLKELDTRFTSEFLDWVKPLTPSTVLGLLRNVMMYEDIDRYFKESWKGVWSAWSEEDIEHFKKRYSDRKIQQIEDSFKIHRISLP